MTLRGPERRLQTSPMKCHESVLVDWGFCMPLHCRQLRLLRSGGQVGSIATLPAMTCTGSCVLLASRRVPRTNDASMVAVHSELGAPHEHLTA